MTPATYNFQTYYGNTYGFAFILLNDEGDPLDMSLFTGFSMRLFTPRRENDPWLKPELTVRDNVVTGTLQPDDVERLAGVYYYELNATYDGGRVTLVNGRVLSARANTGGTQKAADLNLTVNIDPLEV